MESQSDLEGKLSEYAQQLAQVEELLLIDAANPQFLKLKEDLGNVISLTKALLIQVIGNNLSGLHQVASESKAVSHSNQQVSSASSSSSSSTANRSGAIQVGEVVEVLGGERLFAGVVTAIINETEYKIKYFEYPDEVSLPINSLQRIPISQHGGGVTSSGPGGLSLTKEQIVAGLSCQCKYAVDQNWYDCKIASLTPHGCVVTYTAYGNSEEVPLAYLRPAMQSKTTGAGANNSSSSIGHGSGGQHGGNSKSGAKGTVGGLLPIPDSLTILPTDTEKVI